MRAKLHAASWSRRRHSACIFLLAGLFLAFSHLPFVASADSTPPPPAVYETDEYIRIQPELASQTSRLSDRTVLAYITPWNQRGIEMVDTFAEKIDMVSPVWYTILVSRSGVSRGGDDATYVLSGGPPSKKEEKWLTSKQGGKMKIVPRFYLDKWEQKDYADLLSNRQNWQRLAQVITQEVSQKGYDGIVFESAATHLLFEPIQSLSSSLKHSNKTMTVVLPPLKTPYSVGTSKLDRMQESTNRMIVQSIPQLAQVVDFFSIMTYDMSGVGGRVSAIEGKDLGEESPLRAAKKGSLRQPGANTSPKWVEENVQMIVDATRAAAKAKRERRKKQREAEREKEARKRKEQDEVERMKDPSNPFGYDDFAADEILDEDSVGSGAAEAESDVLDRAQEEEGAEAKAEEQDDLALIRGKLLMGMPMYGYRYPVFWIDKSTGQGILVTPPANPDEAKELFSRTSSSTLLPFLRGPAEAVTMDSILSILDNHDGVILDPKDHGEGWFDYIETVTRESVQGKESQGLKPGDQIYWRMYLPLPSTTKDRLEALEGENEQVRAGVSLWELGQANALLLHSL